MPHNAAGKEAVLTPGYKQVSKQAAGDGLGWQQCLDSNGEQDPGVPSSEQEKDWNTGNSCPVQFYRGTHTPLHTPPHSTEVSLCVDIHWINQY